jgi:acyl-CoA synthetase (AMP-forming)/AMP-acid ligase II
MFPMDVLHSIAVHGLTGFSATPTACRILCNLALETEEKYDSVRFVMCGGQFLDLGLVRLIESIFPRARVVNMYGCTENSPRIAYHYADEPDGSDEHGYFPVGRPVLGTDVRIVVDSGDAAPGETGEVVIRGTSLMRGYWRDAETTRERLRDGWFHTRDLGYADPRGRLYLTGRQSTIINIGNEKVSPEEVEKVLLEFAGVTDAAVYGRPDRLLGESVEAQLVLDAGAQTLLGDIQRHCRERISGYKVPRRFVTVNAIPRTLYGKIDRARLREVTRQNVEV